MSLAAIKLIHDDMMDLFSNNVQDLVLSPIPNLVKDGVTLSSINPLSAPDSVQFHDALRRFVPRSRNIEEDSRYLNASLQIYQALSLACWSIGGKEFDYYRQLLKPLGLVDFTNSRKSVFMNGALRFSSHRPAALLEILIARMNRDTKKIEHSLQKLLKTCGACSSQDKYEVILLAATAGVDPNLYIPKVKGLECKDLAECIQDAAKEQIFLAKAGSTVHSRRVLSTRILILGYVVSILAIA
ncbi:uncharacterized protein MELLADRAFT_112887 [Melampsora larici-populina 98AG31]|uniref:Uncharacterized protein n=1 Tax=Melampsora larici-populina (strain 98AG31 / pathotype 3-4-7) TaxID=747676 RepID=F4S805_MELLP|nr:uncharacterized protein MELLADRAFT_112887 [Melampsora larici-populina 98AG31]EGF99200.1 hypothetical protein MELLADRAFT_112887 [Melampsora larici-populina 98AG31]